MTDDDHTDDSIDDEPTTLQDLRVIVSPETERGTRTVVVRQGRQTDAEGPMVLDRDQRATASVSVAAEERSDGATVEVGTDLFLTTKSLPEENPPSRAELADALFETLAALADLRERLAGGAKRSGVDAEQVVGEVWSAYDLDDADQVFERSGHERADAASPEDWAIDERVDVSERGSDP